MKSLQVIIVNLLLVVSSFQCYSQNGGFIIKDLKSTQSVIVGDPGSTHVKLKPEYIQLAQLSASDIENISNPSAGSLVYSTDSDIVLFYNGTEWRSFVNASSSPPPASGCPATVDDFDGNTYDVVEIETQCWMVQSLKVTTFANGTAITHKTQYWAGMSSSDLSLDAYVFYDYDEATYGDYGALYSWPAASARNFDTSVLGGVAGQGICPDGWHLPTVDDWNTLISSLGGGSVAGGKMKEAGITHWLTDNGTNSSGFTALGGGQIWNDYSPTGQFAGIKELVAYWSANVYYNSGTGVYQCPAYWLDYDDSDINTYNHPIARGHHVRCVKND